VVAARWFAVFAVGVTVPYTVVMVLAYLGASVYLDLHPPNPGAD